VRGIGLEPPPDIGRFGPHGGSRPSHPHVSSAKPPSSLTRPHEQVIRTAPVVLRIISLRGSSPTPHRKRLTTCVRLWSELLSVRKLCPELRSLVLAALPSGHPAPGTPANRAGVLVVSACDLKLVLGKLAHLAWFDASLRFVPPWPFHRSLGVLCSPLDLTCLGRPD